MAKKKRDQEHKQLIGLIRSRGIKIQTFKVDEDDELKESWDMADLEPSHPAALNNRVHLDGDGQYLIWPVLFMYPEFGETDFIQEFTENQTYADHFEVMFDDPTNRPGWDPEGRYNPRTISVYFEDKFTRPAKPQMIPVETNSTLSQAICHHQHRVVAGTPSFVLMVKGSKFESEFLKKYH